MSLLHLWHTISTATTFSLQCIFHNCILPTSGTTDQYEKTQQQDLRDTETQISDWWTGLAVSIIKKAFWPLCPYSSPSPNTITTAGLAISTVNGDPNTVCKQRLCIHPPQTYWKVIIISMKIMYLNQQWEVSKSDSSQTLCPYELIYDQQRYSEFDCVTADR